MAQSSVWNYEFRKGLIDIKKGICYIVGASPTISDEMVFKPDNNDLVIAADGGYDFLTKHNIRTDIVLGDFDSATNIPDNVEVLKFPVEKDDTDTFLAYKTGTEYGYRNFIIFGGVGGRFDHTVANLQTLGNIAKNGGRGFLIGDGYILTSICNSSIVFPECCNGNAGVFAYGGNAENVNIKGMKYTVENASLTPFVPLGVSNEFTKKAAEISVENGTLLLVWYEKTFEFLTYLDKLIITQKENDH